MVIGNSWTAPIQITQMDEDDFDNVEETIYLFNTGMDSEEQRAKDPDAGDNYKAGTYITIPISSSPYTGDSVISALQGFYVASSESLGGEDGTLKLNYSKHVRPVGNNSVINGAMHAPKHVNAQKRPHVLKVKVSGSRYDDRLIILEREDFSTGFDNGWDGKKLDEPGEQPMLYTTRPDGTPDAVSAIPELDGTIIGFRAGEDNTYTLHFEYDESAEDLYLFDTETTQSTQILTDSTYTFTDTNTEPHQRFILTRNKAPQITTGEKPISDSSLKGRATKLILDQKLYIYRNGVLYDAMGKRVSELGSERMSELGSGKGGAE